LWPWPYCSHCLFGSMFSRPSFDSTINHHSGNAQLALDAWKMASAQRKRWAARKAKGSVASDTAACTPQQAKTTKEIRSRLLA
jgi:hypothetical protein